MLSSNDLLNRINRKYKNMSKGQKALANYITEEYEKAVFFTAAKLGETVCVSESTVVRFAKLLGYKGYPEFQNALEEMVQSRLYAGEGTKMSFAKVARDDVLTSIMTSDASNIEETLKSIDPKVFDHAVDMILNARKIYVIGIRSCAPLASFLAFYLNYVSADVVLLQSTNTSEIFEQMIRIGEDDVIIGISFPRYSMRTIKALEFANTRRAKVITLSDSASSPLNLYSSCNLIAKSDMASVVDSLVAPLSVINALIVALFTKRQAEVSDNISALDRIWEEYQFYDRDELDPISNALKYDYGDKEEADE